ncbi:MAG TPA: asparagine synthase-related protein [Acidobacteriota bacterium]|nr:asparagine synthase-related protein [Acidobacteriota bacterium]
MPGLVGLVTKLPREWAEPQLLRMVESLCHQSSYRTGTWFDESSGVYVGWSVRKDSFSDGMPLRNENGKVILVFSGEEFPEPGTARRLKERGHGLDTEGPSYLVHLYEEDSAFPAGLNGRFHGLLADQARRTATLFVDRYGMHRIYYHISKEAFYFSAEAKAILAVRPELRCTDARSLGEYISCGCVLENRTLFEGVHVLPPGSAWVCRNGAVEQQTEYFQATEWEKQGPLDPESYYRELRDVFSRNLPRYFNGRERIGMSLTGGLDTRMILALWKAPPGSLPCYTFGGSYRDSQDVIIARKVAKLCGQSHEVIPVGQEFLSRFPEYAERTVYLTDGCADVSCSPVLYTNERAAQIAPVRMTGNYGSEILRRMVALRPSEPLPGLFHPALSQHVREARTTYARLFQGHPVSIIAFRQVPWHHWGLLSLEQTQVSPRSPYLANDVVRTAFRVPDPSIVKRPIFADNDDCLRLIADGDAVLSEIRTDRGLTSRRGPSAVLARAFLELTFKAEYEYDYGMRSWAARIDHLAGWLQLERLFLGRHKYYHFRVWYRDALAGYIREMLLDPRTLSRPYLDRKKLQDIVRKHLNGEGNYTTAIHKVLTLELLYRLLIDQR